MRAPIFGGTTLSGAVQVSRLFELSGLVRLSGLERKELSGEDHLLARTVVYQRSDDEEYFPDSLGELPGYGAIVDDVDLRGGKVFGSLFLLVDSAIGPSQVGSGWV